MRFGPRSLACGVVPTAPAGADMTRVEKMRAQAAIRALREEGPAAAGSE